VQRLSRKKGITFYQDVANGKTSWITPERSGSAMDKLGNMVHQSMIGKTGEFLLTMIYKSIPVRVPVRTSGLEDYNPSPLPGQSEDVPTTGVDSVSMFGQEKSGNVATWKRLNEEAQSVIRSTDHLRANVLYRENDSRTVYRGEIEGQKRHGLGMLQFVDGVTYHGQWSNDLPDGYGTETYPEGFVYQGEFRQDQRHGTGVLECYDLVFFGAWKNGKRHGEGVEKIVLRGKVEESFVKFHNGELVDRERAAVENKEQVSEIMTSVMRVCKIASLHAERSRCVAEQIRLLHEIPVVAEAQEEGQSDRDEEEFIGDLGDPHLTHEDVDSVDWSQEAHSMPQSPITRGI